MIIKSLIFLLLIIFFSSCGGGESSSNTSVNTNSKTKIAYLSDAAINGLEYRCGEGELQVTKIKDGVSGSFEYQEDCTVTFYAGKIEIGAIDGAKISNRPSKIIYPVDLNNDLFDLNSLNSQNVRDYTNLFVFLQSLDDDLDPSNDINIPTSYINNLKSSNTDFLKLTDKNIDPNDLNKNIHIANPSINIVKSENAVAHFELTIKKDVNESINFSGPVRPFLSEGNVTHVNEDNETFEVNGEVGSKILVAFTKDLNTSDLSYIDINKTIQSNGKEKITLDFSNDNISKFYYYIVLEDEFGLKSLPLFLDIFKDVIAPIIHVANISVNIREDELLILDLNITDASKVIFTIKNNSDFNNIFKMTNFSDCSNSSQTYDNHFLCFKDNSSKIDFDTNPKKEYVIKYRVTDQASNTTDSNVTLNIQNILDNPPKLFNTNFKVNILETIDNSEFVFDLNSTLENNLSIAPDNNTTLSPLYYEIDNTDKFDLNRTTGRITVKNNSLSFFDFEINPNPILNITFSIENNNTRDSNGDSIINSDDNKTSSILQLTLINQIDTIPTLLIQANVSVPERSLTEVTRIIADINPNISTSDKNLTMDYNITSSNSNFFTINPNTGTITLNTSDTLLDFETQTEHNISVRATNTFDKDGSKHSDDINFTVNIINVIDNAPLIVKLDENISIPESTAVNFVVAQVGVNGTIFDQNQTTIYEIVNDSSDKFKITNDVNVSIKNDLLSIYNETTSNTSQTTLNFGVLAKNIDWKGSTLSSNTLFFSISLNNVIDNAPVLKTNLSAIDINESRNIGDTVFIQDLKSGNTFDENNVSTFYIVSGNTNNSFEIDSSGKIKILNTLDFENNSTRNYFLSIVASNIDYKGDELNSTSKTVSFVIKNAIESVPDFYLPTNLSIHENIDLNELILTIETNSSEVDKMTIDSFSISNAISQFTIATSSDPYDDDAGNNAFVDLKLGALSINSALDYETTNSYTIDINATNSFGSAIKSIDINITNDVEDTPLLVTLVGFNDKATFTSEVGIKDLIFTTLNAYYSSVSNNKFQYTPVTDSNGSHNGVIILDINTSHPTTDPIAPTIENIISMIKDSNDTNLTSYDSNNDGNLSKEEIQFLFIFAGGEREYGDTDESIQAQTQDFDGTLTIDNNLTLTGNYTVVGEKNGVNDASIGLIAKHLSHNTLNFPYLGFNTTTHGIGMFGLMGYGFKGSASVSNAIGTFPVAPSAFNLIKNGWTYPVVIKKTPDTTISLISSNQKLNATARVSKGIKEYFNIIRINDKSDSKKYYLLENRESDSSGRDQGFLIFQNNGISTSFIQGIAVWRIDENIGAKLVDLVEQNNNDASVELLDNGPVDTNGSSSSLFNVSNFTKPAADTGFNSVIELKSLNDNADSEKSINFVLEVK